MSKIDLLSKIMLRIISEMATMSHQYFNERSRFKQNKIKPEKIKQTNPHKKTPHTQTSNCFNYNN